MRFVFINLIKLYWVLVPEHKRRPCLFRESCSRYVFRAFLTEGVRKGILAFKLRFQQCRPGYLVRRNAKSDAYEMILKDGAIVAEKDIALNLLPTKLKK